MPWEDYRFWLSLCGLLLRFGFSYLRYRHRRKKADKQKDDESC